MKKLFTFIACLVCVYKTGAQIKLPRLVSDSMILQRDTPVMIWGWAGKAEKVSVRFNNKTYNSRAARDGKWSVQLPAMKAGGPYTMVISGKNRITLKDILFGDVWICSGQSNMVHQMKLHSVRYEKDIASAGYPEIRHFGIPIVSDLQAPHEDIPGGSWKWANPQDVLEFSAVAYFFARDLYERYHIPIGLINASVGGSPIESWMSEESLKEFPVISATIQKNKDTAYVNDIIRKAAELTALNQPKPEDKGMLEEKHWYDPSYIPNGWRPIHIPGYWEDQGIKDLDGIVWYRKEIEIPASMTTAPSRLFMGRIVDADIIYINGTPVGNTTYMYPQRRYSIPAGLLKAGKNLVVVRVTNNNNKGGFVPDKPYYLFTGKDTINLEGSWEYKVGQVFTPSRPVNGITIANQPSALFNGMLAPVINYRTKGFLWYQGESNTGRPEEYKKLQPALVADWRKKWKQGDLPFLYVQLPNFMDAVYQPSESQWANFRDAQLSCLSVPNSAMAVTIDLGEWNDLHPDRKKEVGDRLALAARKLAYGENIVYSGPVFRSASINGNKIIITFDHTGSGLTTNDGEAPAYFSIAGADRKFTWAKARIEADKIVVWNDSIAAPLYIRYAWGDNPDAANLYNKEGLPASPFKTDK